MKKVLLISMGANDRLLVEGRSVLAAHAVIEPDRVSYIEELAEHALTPDDGALAVLLNTDCEFIIGCSRPRAVQALLSFAGIAWQALKIEWMALPFDQEFLKGVPGVPWYPVIDRRRCTGCGTCHEYCLFSVYARVAADVSTAAVQVKAPHNCKTGCPACARLCPVAALIFPFCAEAELNGGVENPAPRTQSQMMQALGDDPLRILAERRKQRQLIDPAKFKQAEQERINYSGVL